MTEGIWDSLPRSIDSNDEASKNLELEDVLSKLIFTPPSWNWVTCFIWVFGASVSGFSGFGLVAFSKIYS